MSILNLVKFQLIKLFSSYRFWVSIIVIILTVFFNYNIPAFCNSFGIKATPWTMPFLLITSITITFGLVAIVMFCDAPFTDSNELFCLIRVSRSKWFISRIIFIFSVSLIIPIIVYIVTLATMFPTIIFANEWGDFYKLLLQDEGYMSKYTVILVISENILNNYTPLQATLLSGGMLSIGVFTLGSIILTINLYINRIIGSSIAVFACYLMQFSGGLPYLKEPSLYSPMIWCNLDLFDLNQITLIVIKVLIFNAILIVLSYFKFRKADINIFESI